MPTASASVCLWLLQFQAVLAALDGTATGEALLVPESFQLTDPGSPIASFPEGFEFGLATAPAHVEDQLEDSWIQFAREGKVAAWNNYGRPEERTRFWTDPSADIDLAAATGATIFRMGIDWGRLVGLTGPPAEGSKAAEARVGGVLLEEVWARYRSTMLQASSKGMKIMLTLFHHSMPRYLEPRGGWANATTVDEWTRWVDAVFESVGNDVELSAAIDSVLTMNEPHVFALFTHCAAMWPPAREVPPVYEQANCFTPWGNYGVAMSNMARAHSVAFDAIRTAGLKARVGSAHNVAMYEALSMMDEPGRAFTEAMTTYWFQDLIGSQCDFIGINYYGREILSFPSVALLEREEYSDSGRSIYVEGLFHMLMGFHRRFPSMPLVVTENGVADEHDAIRRPYLLEHLLATSAAIQAGAPVVAYIFWTISDNWEWADGYCPKFGLAAVDRADPEMRRVPRPSYHLFTKVVAARAITAGQRQEAWAALAALAEANHTRVFCRADDGQASLNEPKQRQYSKRDWRYGHRRPEAKDAGTAGSGTLRGALRKLQASSREMEESWARAAREAAEAASAWAAHERNKSSEWLEFGRQQLKQGIYNLTSGVSTAVASELDEAASAAAAWRHRSEQIRAELRHAARTAKRSQSYGVLRGAVAAVKSGLKRLFGEKIFRAHGAKDEL